ncbi:hypothetical protein NSS85_09065 [Paenibacillus sp. FSL R7-0331]|nr:hypothetical protein [Paenibacillus sp. FSL R7-0331]
MSHSSMEAPQNRTMMMSAASTRLARPNPASRQDKVLNRFVFRAA